MTARLRRIGSAIGLAAAAALLLAANAAAAPGSNPTAQISDVTTQPGVVQYLFSVSGLSPNQHLDAGSVTVTAAGTSLDATAAPPDSPTVNGQAKAPLREVILTLDVSGSMEGSGITAARNAAVAYARSLPSDVRIGVITFSDQPTVLLQPTSDRNKVVSVIRGVQAGGNTSLYDAVVTAAGALHSLPADATRRLVILSDGDDTTSTHSLADAQAALRTNKVAADVVAFRIPGDPTVLKSLASASGGQVIAASSAGDLAGAFQAVAQKFDQQVLVTIRVTGNVANTRQTLLTSLNVGDTSVSATTTVDFPSTRGGSGATNGAGPLVGPPVGKSSNASLILVCSVTFIALLVVALTALWLPAARRLEEKRQARLAEVNRYHLIEAMGGAQGDSVDRGSQPSELSQRALALVDRTVRSGGKRDQIVDELGRAGLRLRPEEWVIFQASAVIVTGAVIALLSHSIFGLFAGGLLAFAASRIFINFKIGRRSAAFVEQLPDTLQLIAGSLRSGFSLEQALVGVVREGSEPTAGELSRALTEVRLGSQLTDALDDTARRMSCDDLHWVVLAVRISREVGGNLAEVLQGTVGMMRERSQIRGQIRVLSAEGRISARILIALPFVMTAYLLVFRRSYLKPLIHTGTGVALICVGVGLLLIGSFWIRRLVKIEV